MQKTIFFVGQNQKITPAIFSNKPWKIQTPSKKRLPYQKCPLFLPCQMRHRGNSLGAPSWLSGRSARPSLDAENVSGRAPFQQQQQQQPQRQRQRQRQRQQQQQQRQQQQQQRFLQSSFSLFSSYQVTKQRSGSTMTRSTFGTVSSSWKTHRLFVKMVSCN